MPEHIDALYGAVSALYMTGVQLLTAVWLTFLCRDFMKTRRGAGWLGAVYFCAVTVFYCIPVPMGNFTAYFWAFSLTFAVCLFLDSRAVRMKTFLFVTAFSVRWMVYVPTNRIVGFLLWGAEQIAGKVADLASPSMWKFYLISFVAECVAELALKWLLLWGILRMIRGVFSEKQRELDGQELCILLIPSVSGMVCYEIFQVYLVRIGAAGNVGLYPDAFVDALWTLYCLAMLVGILSTILVYEKSRTRRKEAEEARLLENELRDMQAHIGEVERLYAQIRSVRHDIGNHVSVLSGLLSQGKTEEACRYLGTLQASADAVSFAVKTGNPVTDVILDGKMRDAKERGISFETDFHYPADMGFDAFDISVILSNALSNAIEAAGESGFVRISSFRSRGAFLITVENSFTGSLPPEDGSGLPAAKSGDGWHGFGLKNMRAAAEKYYGGVELVQEENLVRLTVLLQTASREEQVSFATEKT